MRTYAAVQLQRIAPAVVGVGIVSPIERSGDLVVKGGVDIAVFLLVPLQVKCEDSSIVDMGLAGLQRVVADNRVAQLVAGGRGDAVGCHRVVDNAVKMGNVQRIVCDDGVGILLLDRSIPLHLAHRVVRLSHKERVVVSQAHATRLVDGNARHVAGALVNIRIHVRQPTILTQHHPLPDKARRELVACVVRIVVGGKVDQMVGG